MGFLDSLKKSIFDLGTKDMVNQSIKALDENNELSDAETRKSAEELLIKVGAPAVEPLINALKDTSSARRQGVAKILGEIRDTRAVKPLIAALQNSDSEVRKVAIEALKNIGGEEAEKAIREYAEPTTTPPSASPVSQPDEPLPSLHAEILRFLNSERTRGYEAQTNCWWSLADMVTLIMKTGMHHDWGDVSVTNTVANALADLYEQGRIQLNPNLQPSRNIEANAKYIREKLREDVSLFRAK
ncbi:MAG: HEAT repeat domain-containing protein [Chloroflexi bacterium]|nr:HEAT repeat domain-containing protein [Chloroflexota bacterium]